MIIFSITFGIISHSRSIIRSTVKRNEGMSGWGINIINCTCTWFFKSRIISFFNFVLRVRHRMKTLIVATDTLFIHLGHTRTFSVLDGCSFFSPVSSKGVLLFSPLCAQSHFFERRQVGLSSFAAAVPSLWLCATPCLSACVAVAWNACTLLRA